MRYLVIVITLIMSGNLSAQLHTYNWTNGKKKAEGVVKDALEQGKWTFWSKDGIIQQEVTYKDGVFHGAYVNYDENGKKQEEGTFVNAKKEGICKMWYSSGQIEMIGYNKNGFNDSLWTFYYEDGKKKD